MKFFAKIQEALTRFMQGRNGADQLSLALVSWCACAGCADGGYESRPFWLARVDCADMGVFSDVFTQHAKALCRKRSVLNFYSSPNQKRKAGVCSFEKQPEVLLFSLSAVQNTYAPAA